MSDFVASTRTRVDRRVIPSEEHRYVPNQRTKDSLRSVGNDAYTNSENAYRMVVRTKNPFIGTVRLKINPSQINRSTEKQRVDENVMGGFVSQHFHPSATKFEIEGHTGRQGIAVIRLLDSLIGTSVEEDIRYDKNVEIHYRGEVWVGSFDSFRWTELSDFPGMYPFSFAFTAFKIYGRRSV